MELLSNAVTAKDLCYAVIRLHIKKQQERQIKKQQERQDSKVMRNGFSVISSSLHKRRLFAPLPWI